MKYDVSVVGFGDNVVDIYTHENVQYPGGNCVNLAVYAKMLVQKGVPIWAILVLIKMQIMLFLR